MSKRISSIKLADEYIKPIDSTTHDAVDEAHKAFLAGWAAAINKAAEIAQHTYDEQGLIDDKFEDGARYAAAEIKEWILKENEQD